MAPDSHAHALTVFESFLAFARSGDALANKASAPVIEPDPAETAPDSDPSENEITRVGPRPRSLAKGGSAPKHAPRRATAEKSIIVEEEESLTDPEFEKSTVMGSVDLRGSARIPVEQFVDEMSVLIKYGHTAQAAEETERWIASHPDDLAAQVQLTEFQLARLDRNAAIDRFVSLVGRMVERGQSVQASDLVNRLRRDAPEDHRVGALASRMGRF